MLLRNLEKKFRVWNYLSHAIRDFLNNNIKNSTLKPKLTLIFTPFKYYLTFYYLMYQLKYIHIFNKKNPSLRFRPFIKTTNVWWIFSSFVIKIFHAVYCPNRNVYIGTFVIIQFSRSWEKKKLHKEEIK